MIQKADMRLESGTCNVCSAPCSSCMHLNHALMGSKAEEFSDENCRIGEANSQCSVDEGNLSSIRSRACEGLQHTVSETSHMLSVNSSHDSLSENAESRQTLSNKYQDSKYIEGHDDNTSCISRASDVDVENNSHQRNAEGINISCSSASVSRLGAEGSGSAPSVDISGSSDIPSSKDADTGHSSPSVQNLIGQSQRGKYLSGSPRLMHPEGDPCSHIPEKLSECSFENTNLSLTKETPTIVVSGEKSIANKDSLIDGTAKVSLKLCPKSEADTDNVGDAKNDGHKCSVKDGQHEKAEELIKSPTKQELKSEDESDESDVVEHDVKVCDICGDAGREDLLAICSRCSDGAEHTYCMREMLQKVPEGDWLCEECKYEKETENQRLGKSEDVSDVEEKKVLKVGSSSQVSCEQLSENVEVAPAAKRQALESITGSPKGSSPKRLVPLSRESSFKNLDKGKVKPGHVMPIRNPSGDDREIARSPSVGPRSQIKGTLSKCNSFNTLNSKPRVKLVDEVLPRQLKVGGEQTSKNMETPARITGKSTLFKSSSLGRSSANEPKVKMLSPKSVTSQELKGSRHLKESSAFDRKFPSRIDRPVVGSSMASSVVSTAKGDQKPTSRGETTKSSAVNNNRELKVDEDGKLSTLPKSISNVGRKVLESQVSSERTSTSVDEALQDVLHRSRETANQVEKTRGSSGDRVKPVVTTVSKSPFCPKCKENGHDLEQCTAGSTQEPGAEVSVTALSSSKEEMHTGNRLKAAIQAALLRRPEIYKKKEVPNQTDEVSTSSTDMNCEVNSQDQLMVSSTPKNSISAEETHEQQEILENSTSDSSKCSSANDLKQLNNCPTDFCSQRGKSDSIGLDAGKPVVRDLSNKALAIPSVLSKMLVIPEYEYVWQGVFEVHRIGKPPDLCAGVQAHLSSCASPKVLDAINKFLPKVPLNEVPRLSTWPSQFHQGGAREDHIALYFFAKDIESYERHYKDQLDHMIRNDLALKGTFDGVELLIFPSNLLPENSQRWNMLFFLWGVFRGRRIISSDSTKNIRIPSLNAMPVEEDSSTAVVTLSEMHSSPKHMGEESIGCDKVCSALVPSTSVDQDQITSSRNIKISEKANVLEHGQCRESEPPEAMGTSGSSRIVETKTDFDIAVEQEKALSPGVPSLCNQERGTTSIISKDKVSGRDNSYEDQQRRKRKLKEDDHYIDLEATVVNQETCAESTTITDKISGKMNSDEDQQRPKRKLKEDDHYIDLEETVVNQKTCAESNTIMDKISGKMNSDEDQQMPKRKLKEDELYIDLEATVGNQETGTSNDKIPEKMNGDEDWERPKRRQNDDHYIDLEAAVDNDETGAASNICKDKVLGRIDSDEDKLWSRMKHKYDHYIDLGATFQGDMAVVGADCQLPNDKQVQFVDLSETVMQASAVCSQKRPWNVVNGKFEDGGSSSKSETGFSGIYGCYGSEGRDSLNVARGEKLIGEDLGTMERTFFPVGSQNISDSHLVLNSMSLKGHHEYENQFQDGIPNLELALGGENKPPPLPPPPKGMLPFLVGAVDRKNSQETGPDGLADGQEDDAVAASLSLSLSFPSSNKEHKKSASKAEVLPDGHRVNTPFLLFGRYTDK